MLSPSCHEAAHPKAIPPAIPPPAGRIAPLPPARRRCPRNAFVRGSPPHSRCQGLAPLLCLYFGRRRIPPPLLPPPAALLLIHFHRRFPLGMGGAASPRYCGSGKSGDPDYRGWTLVGGRAKRDYTGWITGSGHGAVQGCELKGQAVAASVSRSQGATARPGHEGEETGGGSCPAHGSARE